MRRPKCDFENPEYAVVCEQCGEFLPKEDPTAKNGEPILDPNAEKQIRCSYCWHSNPGEAEVCEVCGMPLRYIPHPESEGEYAVPTREELLPKVVPNETPDNPVPEGRIRCRKCWFDNPADAVKCESCGKLLKGVEKVNYNTFVKSRSDTIHCQGCGCAVPWSTITCPACGAQPRVRRVRDERTEYRDLLTEFVEDSVSSLVKKAGSLGDEFSARRKVQKEKAAAEARRAASSSGKKVRCRSCRFDNPLNAENCQCCGAPLKINIERDVKDRKPCECGFQGNSPDAVVCINCNGWLKRKCPSCGYENDARVTICANCRERLAEPKKIKPW